MKEKQKLTNINYKNSKLNNGDQCFVTSKFILTILLNYKLCLGMINLNGGEACIGIWEVEVKEGLEI